AAADRDALMRASGMAVLAVLGADCTGSYGCYTRDGWLELAGGDCRTAREGLRVDAIGPHALDAPAFAAARHAVARCAAHDTVELSGVAFACPQEMPGPAGYWRVE